MGARPQPAHDREAARTALHQGRWDHAETRYRAWLDEEPGSREALHGLGLVLAQRGRTREAAEHLGAAHLQQPDDLELLRNLGIVLGRSLRFERATECLTRVLDGQPEDAVAARHLVRAHVAMGKYVEALEVIERFPGVNFGTFGLEARAAVCDWRTRDSDLATLEAEVRSCLSAGRPSPCSPFGAITLGLSPELVPHLARAAAPAPRTRSARGPRRSGPFRVGYLSPDLHDHPIGLLLAPILEAHDRDRFDVRTYALVDADDPVRSRIARAAPLISLGERDDACIFGRLLQDQLDLLVDLAGFTSAARFHVLAARPARAQAHWLGYPGTLPRALVDWQITHASRLGPSGADEYDEALALLPETFVASEGFPALAEPPRRAEHGLPEGAFVYGFFGAGYRITPELFDGWMLVLRSNPESLMWIQATGIQQDHLRREARARGVDPARLRFAPRGRLSAAGYHTLVDLWLDGWHVASGTASIVAAWSGTPLLTLAGDAPPMRTGAAVLEGARVPELVAESEEVYLRRAIAWGADPESLVPIRTRLLEAKRRSTLFDVPRFTRHLERAFEEMITRTARGETPSTFSV